MKDWTGNTNSIYKSIGATNYSDSEREANDYYATEPIAIDKLLTVETPHNNVWKCACGGGHLSERLTERGYYVCSTDDEQTLLYLDPPYLPELRKRGLYKCEMTVEQHEQLLELVLKSKSKICLSAYDSELYNEKLKGWHTAEKPTTAQMGLHRTEKLYMNYEPDLLAMANK